MEETLELSQSLSVLEAVLKATADGLLVADKLGKVLCYNQLYVNMWHIPSELLTHARHQAILRYCAGQLRDPVQFLHSTEEIYGTWTPESFDVFEFCDGRVFERYTKTKTLEGSNMVRVWSFRDITERGQAET